MAQITFKKFSQFVDLEGEPTDEQITEIFGLFRNNKKLDDLRAKKRELVAKKTAELRAKNAAKQGKTMAQQHDPTQRVSSVTYRAGSAASGKAAERDWVAGLMDD